MQQNVGNEYVTIICVGNFIAFRWKSSLVFVKNVVYKQKSVHFIMNIYIKMFSKSSFKHDAEK